MVVAKNFLTSKIAQKSAGAIRYINGEASTQKALRVTLLLSCLFRENDRPLTLTKFFDKSKEGMKQQIMEKFDYDMDVEEVVRDIQDLNLIQIDANGSVYLESNYYKKLREQWLLLFENIDENDESEIDRI